MAGARETFDFDAIHVFVPMSDTPGNELRDAFGSAYADVGGSLNVGGIANLAVDELIAQIETAESREALEMRVRALDRVLRAMHPRVPYWVRPEVWVALHMIFYRHRSRSGVRRRGTGDLVGRSVRRYENLNAVGAMR